MTPPTGEAGRPRPAKAPAPAVRTNHQNLTAARSPPTRAGFSEVSISDIASLAKSYGYGVAVGIDCVERDVRAGLEIAKKLRGLEEVLLLRTPPDNNANLAFEIGQELIKASMERTPTRFYDFLRGVWNLSNGKVSKIAFFFCGDWYASDRPRFFFGSIEDLIFLLSMTGSWGGAFLTEMRGELQVTDEIPFMFEIEKRPIETGVEIAK